MTVTAIVTMTRARNEAECAEVVPALAALNALGLPVYASDANSIAQFREAVGRLPNVRSQAPGVSLVQQIKSSIRGAAAGGHRFVMYTEPDKRDFFSGGAPAFLADARRHEAAIYIAARDEASFATFPAGQQASESAVNRIASVFLCPLPDLLYGPLVLDLDATMPFLEAVPDDLAFGWRFYAIARAVKNSMPVSGHVGAFACPAEQRGEDDEASRIYRLQQARQCIEGMRLGLSDARGQFPQSPTV